MGRATRSLKRGFTLVETLAAAAIAGIGIASALGALGAIAKSQAKARSMEEIARLGIEKYQTVVATYDLTQTTQNGDFTDEGIDGYNWTALVQASSYANLSYMTLTVKDTRTSNRSYSVTGLVFVPTPGGTTARAGTGGLTTGNGGRAQPAPTRPVGTGTTGGRTG
jgi:prepilin-type N-terminal cleavage/methylation domain-containing protein